MNIQASDAPDIVAIIEAAGEFARINIRAPQRSGRGWYGGWTVEIDRVGRAAEGYYLEPDHPLDLDDLAVAGGAA